MAVTDALATSSAAPDGSTASPRARAVAFLADRHRLQIWEALPWGLSLAAFWLFPDRLTFGSQVLVMVLFALSLDLILGFAGIVTLGQAAYFGVGAYTVGLLLAHLNWGEPISGLFAAAAGAGSPGWAARLVVLGLCGAP